MLNMINALNENGFQLRSDHNGGFYYGKGEYDGYGELMVWCDDGVTWRWAEVVPDMPPIEVIDGEMKVETFKYESADEFFDKIEVFEKEIDAWVKSIKPKK